MRSSVVPLVPRSVQKASRGRVVTVITRMLVISSSPTERGSLYRLIIVRQNRLMLKTKSAWLSTSRRRHCRFTTNRRSPAPGYIWTPGYWAWDDNTGYYWVPGTWVLPPEPALLWTPGYWGWNDGVYAFHEGYWGPEVGFYGGVSYGYGYTGDGYEGGYWRGGAFFYNRTVNNISNVQITNVYNKTVVVNNMTNVSYNGGAGGTTAQATPQQIAAANQHHVPPTPQQTQHMQIAAKDPALSLNNNQGHPTVAATTHPAQLSGAGVVAAHPGTPVAAIAPQGHNVSRASGAVTGNAPPGQGARTGPGNPANQFMAITRFPACSLQVAPRAAGTKSCTRQHWDFPGQSCASRCAPAWRNNHRHRYRLDERRWQSADRHRFDTPREQASNHRGNSATDTSARRGNSTGASAKTTASACSSIAASACRGNSASAASACSNTAASACRGNSATTVFACSSTAASASSCTAGSARRGNSTAASASSCTAGSAGSSASAAASTGPARQAQVPAGSKMLKAGEAPCERAVA